ncbi:hypothetical protein MASR1M90_14350 [Desulfovibrionales bacterium]
MVVLIVFVILKKENSIRRNADAYNGEEDPSSHFSPPFVSGKGSRSKELRR